MWPNPQETADLVTFSEEVLNVMKKENFFIFLCSVSKNFFSVTKSDFREIDMINTSQSNIYDEAFCEKSVNYFGKRFYLRYLSTC